MFPKRNVFPNSDETKKINKKKIVITKLYVK